MESNPGSTLSSVTRFFGKLTAKSRIKSQDRKLLRPRHRRNQRGRRCTEIDIHPPGRNSKLHSSRLWVLTDTGADATCMHRRTFEEIFGSNNFHFYESPRDVLSFDGVTTVQSIGFNLLVFSLKDEDKVYSDYVEILDHGIDEGNFDVILGRDCLTENNLVEINPRLRIDHFRMQRRILGVASPNQ